MLSPMPWPSPTWLPLASASPRVSKIASLGHSGRQAPQEMHSSVIKSAILLASFLRLQNHDYRDVVEFKKNTVVEFKKIQRSLVHCKNPKNFLSMCFWPMG